MLGSMQGKALLLLGQQDGLLCLRKGLPTGGLGAFHRGLLFDGCALKLIPTITITMVMVITIVLITIVLIVMAVIMIVLFTRPLFCSLLTSFCLLFGLLDGR